MILQALVKHYETLAQKEIVPRRGWCHGKISYGLDIDEEGKLLGVVSLKEEVVRRKKAAWIPQMIEVPEVVSRSSGVSANFLCDNSKYLLGVDSNGSSKRILECFEAANEKHRGILESADSPAARAVVKFFQTWKPEQAKENPDIADKWDDITGGANFIFCVNGNYAQRDEEISAAWERYIESPDDGVQEICLVTGKRTSISRIHSTIKGVQGAQSMGAALVSFNAPAFTSYGKEQSYNGPVGEYASFAYTTALNYLLGQRDFVVTLGDTTIIFWAEDGEETYQWLFQESVEPTVDNQEALKNLFSNLQKGNPIDVKGVQINPKQQFFILGLAPNAARLSVRFFYQNGFGTILQNIEKHYQRMEIIKPIWDQQDYLGIWRTVFETVNQKSKDKKPQSNMAAAVFYSILSGGLYPENLYQNVLIRIRAEQGGVNRGRAGIIKAHLIQNYKNNWLKEEEFMGLNERCTSTAYILGREFAILEAIQGEASPGINTTIKDRYFNAACATPAQVFPILLKLKNSHIRKLEHGQVRFEKMLTELQGKIEVKEEQITAYPKRLTLEEQGMFILGYYHQVQKRFEKKEDK